MKGKDIGERKEEENERGRRKRLRVREMLSEERKTGGKLHTKKRNIAGEVLDSFINLSRTRCASR